MNFRPAAIGLVVFWMSGVASAQTLATASLPTFALNPAAFSSSQAIWQRLGDGVEFYSFSTAGSPSWAGAGAFAGYRQQLGGNFALELRTSSGFEPSFFHRNSFSGVEYASTQFRLSYDMGRLRPYVGVSASLANPIGAPGFVIPGSTVNPLPSALFPTQSFTSVSAGFNYSVTNNVSVGVGVSVGTGNRMLSPFMQPGPP